MQSTHHSPDLRRLSAIVAGVMTVVLLAILVVVPLAGRATVCVDDFAWVKLAHATPHFGKSLIRAWSAYLFFRPLDILANWFVNPLDLRSAPIIPFQATGLIVLLAGVWRLTRILSPAGLLAPLAASLWLMLHPATQTSLWAAGTTSQTWCAAIGIWLMCQVMLDDGEHDFSPRAVLRCLALSAVGIVSKELFVGWATAAALVVLARLWRRVAACEPLRLAGAFITVVAILTPPALWIIVRLATSDFGRVAQPSADLHYSFQGPRTIAWNMALSTLGMFVQGPVHWARLRGMPWNLVPIAGAALSLGLAVYGSRPAASVERRGGLAYLLPAAVILGLVAIWPALPIRQVSELYVMGPNALIAPFVGVGVGRVLQGDPASRGSRQGQGWQTPWLLGAVIAIAAIGMLGFASRTYHFLTTWVYARELRTAALALVEGEQTGSPITILIDDKLEQGPVHSKYLVTPALAADVPNSFRAFRLGGADLPAVTFLGEGALWATQGNVVRLDCPVPSRNMW